MYMYSNYYWEKFINNFKLSRRSFSKKIIYKSKLHKALNQIYLYYYLSKKKIFIKKKKYRLNEYIEFSFYTGSNQKNINLIYYEYTFKIE